MPIYFDPTQTKKAAFARGFLKGLAAPCMMYAHNVVPAVPVLEPIRPPTHQGLNTDWVRIGQDVQAAVRRHEQEPIAGRQDKR